jgi:outer membrane protein OmpA-like peptidoglycan-associated protein
MRTTEPRTRLALLQQSLRDCESFDAWYEQGLVLEALGRLHDALEALRSAFNLDGISTQQEAQTQGRMGALYARLGRRCDAELAYRAARRRFAGAEPGWFLAGYKQLLHDREGAVVNREEIVCVLSDKSIGVVPSIDLHIHFEFDKATLDTDGAAQVRELHAALSDLLQGADPRFRLIGHTDVRGSEDYNQQLSERRAATVRMVLERLNPGLVNRLVTEGRGKREPLIKDAVDEQDHKLNRRVVVEKLR